MTWQELADFINNKMPECNRNQQAVAWNASMNDSSGGKFIYITDISPFDAEEPHGTDNFYSVNINTEDWMIM